MARIFDNIEARESSSNTLRTLARQPRSGQVPVKMFLPHRRVVKGQLT